MPNWVVNKLTLKHKNVNKILEKYLSEGKNGSFDFDFNKIIKMPEELANTEVSSRTPKEVYEHNKQTYGYESWYDWACDNWGCKWNASRTDITIDSEDTIIVYFDTAWSPSIKAIEKLHKLEPDMFIEHRYSEEQTTYWEGFITYDKDSITKCEYEEGSKEAFENHFDLWGESEYYEWDEQKGTYVYVG